MAPRPRLAEQLAPACRVLLACAVACVVGGRGASAASLAAGGTPGDGDHARYCQCRGCDPTSCCCGPRRARPAAPPARVAVHRTEAGSPCLKSSPCGEGRGLPVAPLGPVGKAATLAASWALPPPPVSLRSIPAMPCTLPARRAARLDDPPEPTARG